MFTMLIFDKGLNYITDMLINPLQSLREYQKSKHIVIISEHFATYIILADNQM